MDSLADHFVEQATSDLGEAQGMARAGRSGQALGTSMYLCQQSVEKAFKSVLLRLQERAGLKMVEGDLHALSHSLYPELHRLYSDSVFHIKPPRLSPGHGSPAGGADAAKRAAKELDGFKRLSDSWGSEEGRNRRLAWRHSVGVRLDEADLGKLNSFHTRALGLVYESFFGKSHRPAPLVNEKRPSELFSRILESGLTMADFDRHVASRNYAPMHSEIYGAYKVASDHIGHMHMDVPDANHMPRRDAARQAMLKFGFRALALAAHPYHMLHPHSTMGRYPEKIDGKFTDDVYGEQSEYVTKTVFLEGEYLVRELCRTSARVEALWHRGVKAELW